jgi:uncharacterized protein with ATP-grasp and redox domains
MAAQAVEAVRRTVHDEAEREKMIKRILRRFARIDFSEPPPVAARELYRIIGRATGIADPYRGAKDRFTAMALKLLPAFEREIAHARDPFDAALRLAIAGNVIDLGVRGDLTEEAAHHAMQSALDEPVAGDVDGFRDEVRAAGCILYLADNAGELVFDIPLLRAMPAGSVTVAGRGEPVINDATLEDAEARHTGDCAVISNGSACRNRPSRLQPGIQAVVRARRPGCRQGAGELRDAVRHLAKRQLPVQGEMPCRLGAQRI